jgi:hypothetical protein
MRCARRLLQIVGYLSVLVMAQSRDTVGVKVTAKGDSILLPGTRAIPGTQHSLDLAPN